MDEDGEGRQDSTAHSHQDRRSLQTQNGLCTFTLPGKMRSFIGDLLHRGYKSQQDIHGEEWAAITKPRGSLKFPYTSIPWSLEQDHGVEAGEHGLCDSLPFFHSMIVLEQEALPFCELVL